jgi:hypothetical protein
VRLFLSIGVTAVLVAMVLARPAHPAEEGTIKAFAAWQGESQTLQTGTKEATFIDVDPAEAVTEGVSDCKNGNTDVGLRKINEGTAMVHDPERTKMK